MIWSWASIVIGAVLFIIGAFLVITIKRRDEYDRALILTAGGVGVIIGLVMVIGPAFWLYGTEGGARAQKTWQSETGGGLTRVVSHYDMEGDLIERWEGKFDVDANSERIIFDIPQEDGSYKRVQIWPSTGSVTIVEK